MGRVSARLTERSPVSKLTSARSTPGRSPTAFSMLATQPAQCIPTTRASNRRFPAVSGSGVRSSEAGLIASPGV